MKNLKYPDRWGVQHINVMINFTEAILEGKKLLAPGTDGINGVILSNAMHLSSWTGKDIELPFDEDLYLEELNKRRRKLKRANA